MKPETLQGVKSSLAELLLIQQPHTDLMMGEYSLPDTTISLLVPQVAPSARATFVQKYCRPRTDFHYGMISLRSPYSTAPVNLVRPADVSDEVKEFVVCGVEYAVRRSPVGWLELHRVSLDKPYVTRALGDILFHEWLKDEPLASKRECLQVFGMVTENEEDDPCHLVDGSLTLTGSIILTIPAKGSTEPVIPLRFKLGALEVTGTYTEGV